MRTPGKEDTMHINKVNKSTLIISVILAAALLLRLFGIWHGYPYSFYPDEAHFVKRALSFGSLDFNPHWFHKPAFYMYILFFDYGLFFIIGKIIGLWATINDFAVSYVLNPGPFYIIGRITTTLFGLASIWMVYLIGEKFFKKNTGIAGALLLTLSYAHVVSSQDIKADIPASFFAIFSMYLLLNYSSSKAPKWLIYSAVAAGIGAGTKVYPIVMLVPITLAVFLTANGKDSMLKISTRYFSWITAAIAVFWLSYFFSSPYSFIDPLGRVEVFEDFIRLYNKITGFFIGTNISTTRPDDFIAQRSNTVTGIIHFFKIIFDTKGMGPVIASFSFLGAGFLFHKMTRQTLLFFLFPLVFIVISIFTFPGYSEPRHQMPIYPFLALTGGFFIACITGLKVISNRITYSLFAFFLFFPLISIIRYNSFTSKTDTRNIAKKWIENNISAGSKILLDENGPQLLFNRTSLLASLEKAKKADRNGQFTAHYDKYLNYQLLAAGKSISYDISEIRLPWWRDSEKKQGLHELTSDYDRDMGNPLKPVGVNDYQYYVDNNYEYAIVLSDLYQAYLRPNSNKARNFPSFARFYTELFERGELIKEFNPMEGNRPGPIVKIFRFR